MNIVGSLQQNKCLRTFIIGFLYYRLTTGSLSHRFKQLKQILPKPPTHSTMKFSINYYLMVKHWPLLLCEPRISDVSRCKTKIESQKEALETLHAKAGVNSQLLVDRLTASSDST